MPKSWLETSYGFSNSIFLNFIDNNGCEFIGSHAYLKWDLLSLFGDRVQFYKIVQFHELNLHFIEQSQGRINLKIYGHRDGEEFYLPIIIDGFEPEDGVSAEVEERHRNMQKIIKQYEEDLRNYYEESEKIQNNRKQKEENTVNGSSENYGYAGMDTIGSELLRILEDSEESPQEYLYAEEDKRQKELEEKYKDAIAWRGPLLHGLAAKLDGFEIRVYSNDHGQHFHVIHRGKNINARFSYPQMELMSYVSGTSISAKTAGKISNFCKKPEISSKLEAEFARR